MFSTNADRATVLLVDDDDLVRAFCRLSLERDGYRILEADSGMEALLITMQWKGAIDLVITDLAMPSINGAELGRALKELWPDLHVVYMSGSPDSVIARELPAGTQILPKPFAMDDLLNAVERRIPLFAEA